eukprot:995723-Amphidinium_carterae.1
MWELDWLSHIRAKPLFTNAAAIRRRAAYVVVFAEGHLIFTGSAISSYQLIFSFMAEFCAWHQFLLRFEGSSARGPSTHGLNSCGHLFCNTYQKLHIRARSATLQKFEALHCFLSSVVDTQRFKHPLI